MKSIVFATALLAVLPIGAAVGQNRTEVRVSHADLDLRTKAGVRALDRRIVSAAERVCPAVHAFPDLARQAVARRCITLAVTNAKPQRDRVLAARRVAWMAADRNGGSMLQ